MSAKKHVYSSLEKKLFLEILKKFSNIVENKDTDGATLKMKSDAWEMITREYNASPHATAQSTIKQLRRLWMNLKQRQREALTKKRQHRIATGGGHSAGDPGVSLVAPTIVGVTEAINSDMFNLAEPKTMQLSYEDSQPITSTPDIPSPDQQSIVVSPSAPALTPAGIVIPRQIRTSIPTSVITYLKNKKSILEKDYQDRRKRAEELHEMEMELIRQKIREARAKADLAELIYKQQQRSTNIIAKTP